ncbi:MAG: LPS export ABC transporter ATP-binding protein [Planctomycetota bacterium]
MLIAQGLEKTYRNPVVRGVDLRVHPGEVVGLLGPNGAGKTTTFRMVVGMVTPDVGTVSFLGHDVTRLPMHRRAQLGMGYQPQEHSVFRDLTVEQNLLVVFERLSIGRRERRRQVVALLEEYGLLAKRDDLARNLSGGQKRRLEIARALITQPRLMLFDEPFAGVDPIMVGDIQEVVYGLRDKGIAVFITDHDARQILSTSDRVYLMFEGQVVVEGAPQTVLDSALARQVYLGEGFELDLSKHVPQGARGEAEGAISLDGAALDGAALDDGAEAEAGAA